MTKPSLQHNDFAVVLICSDVLDDEEFSNILDLYRVHLKKRLRFFHKEIPAETVRKKRAAMANGCPAGAIEFKELSRNAPRCRNPEVALRDMYVR